MNNDKKYIAVEDLLKLKDGQAIVDMFTVEQVTALEIALAIKDNNGQYVIHQENLLGREMIARLNALVPDNICEEKALDYAVSLRDVKGGTLAAIIAEWVEFATINGRLPFNPERVTANRNVEAMFKAWKKATANKNVETSYNFDVAIQELIKVLEHE